MVVVDVRGDIGGASMYGDALAAALLGARRNAGDDPSDSGCDGVWRASPGNLAFVQSVIRTSPGSPLAQYYARAETEMEQARRDGRELTASPASCRGAREPGARASPARAPKVIILTDANCFSSCLMMVSRFRRLGAIQAGQPTDQANRYMEVRGELLPSRLARFTTLQKAASDRALKIGPFEPDLVYPGDMRDTRALEAWLSARIGG
jgi:hypothetical protein